MGKLVITKDNAEALEPIGAALAETYRIAFAGEPWFEKSRCPSKDCSEGFSVEETGSYCVCGECRVEAYNSEELVEGWSRILTEGGIIEVKFKEDDPVRTTVARPTTPDELFMRKYGNVPSMKQWLADNLPKELVWIEDTFANRNVSPSGNLSDRGETLGLIEGQYGLPVATRTLAPQIVAATLRDCPGSTRVFMGAERVGCDIVNRAFNNPSYPLPEVPDRRTLLVVEGGLSAT